MSEPIKEITNQMITRIFNTLYGERKVVFRLIVMVIVFFKALVMKLYRVPISFPVKTVVITLLALAAIYPSRLSEKLKAADYKIIFLYSSFALGHSLEWISNQIWPLPEMTLYIEELKNTSRLGWVAFMCQWENIAPSLYFLSYFVTKIYLAVCFLKAIGYMNDADNGMMGIRKAWLNHTCKYAVASVICSSSWAYWGVYYLFVLLE